LQLYLHSYCTYANLIHCLLFSQHIFHWFVHARVNQFRRACCQVKSLA
jgi:hypothetical protein